MVWRSATGVQARIDHDCAHRLRSRLRRLVLVAAVLGLPATAHAEDAKEAVRVRVELGGAAMLSDYQRDTLDYGGGVVGTLRLGYRVVDAFALQAGVEWWRFPSDAGSGETLGFGGGARLEPRIGELGRLFLDAFLGLGRSEDLSRVGLSVGLGFEFEMARGAVGLGPFLRYGQLFATDNDFPEDARYLGAGVSLSLGAPRPIEVEEVAPEEPADSDGDGVVDADDLCPREPAGDQPDPEKPGCPLLDSDDDGVADREDICPRQPQGEHPDPERSGCPAGDADGDSVFDHQDGCPTTPAGEHPDPDRTGCPDGDDDGDGVRNHPDQCPEEHHGLHPDPERPGCPQPDRDGDTIPDEPDACPDKAGAPHPNARRHGCPSLVRIEEGQLRITKPVFFATNRERILPRSRPVLRAVANALKATPEIRRVSIEGHTDDVGDADYNLDLSQRRAQSVMSWLTREGVEPERLETHGYGESRPVVEGETEDARAANRRVEFRIVDPPMSQVPPEPESPEGSPESPEGSEE